MLLDFLSPARLRKMGLTPVTRDAAPAGKQYPYVLFAAPPSGSEDYPAAVSQPAPDKPRFSSWGTSREVASQHAEQ